MFLGRNLRQDYIQKCVVNATGRVSVGMWKVIGRAIRDRGFRAVFLYRVGRHYHRRGHKILARLTERLIHRWCFCEISLNSDIGPGFSVYHPFGLVVGIGVKAGENLTLSMNAVLGGNIGKQRPDGSEYPILGDNVNIAAGSKVVGPISIGDNCLIGPNAVVTKDMPSDSLIGGIPAQVIKQDGQRVNLLEYQGQLYDVLRDIQARLEAVEKKLVTKDDEQCDQ